MSLLVYKILFSDFRSSFLQPVTYKLTQFKLRAAVLKERLGLFTFYSSSASYIRFRSTRIYPKVEALFFDRIVFGVSLSEHLMNDDSYDSIANVLKNNTLPPFSISTPESDLTVSRFRRSGSERLRDGAKAFLRRVESLKSRRRKQKNREGVVISGPLVRATKSFLTSSESRQVGRNRMVSHYLFNLSSFLRRLLTRRPWKLESKI